MITEIINKHPKEDYFYKLNDIAQRIKIFKTEFKDFRNDFNKKDFLKILNINLKLIKKFPSDHLIYDRVSRIYASQGSRNKSREYFNKSLKIQRDKYIKKNETGLIFFISMMRSGGGYVSRSLKKGLKLKDLNPTTRFIDSLFPYHSIFPFQENHQKKLQKI